MAPRLHAQLRSYRDWVNRRWAEDIQRIRTNLANSGRLLILIDNATALDRSAVARAILAEHGAARTGADPERKSEWMDAAGVTADSLARRATGAPSIPWVIDRADALDDEAIGALALELHRSPRTLILLADRVDERLSELRTVAAMNFEHLALAPMSRLECGLLLEHMLSGAVAASAQEALWASSGGELAPLRAHVAEHLQRERLVRAEGLWMLQDWGESAKVSARLRTILEAESTLSTPAQKLYGALAAQPTYLHELGNGLGGASVAELKHAGLIHLTTHPDSVEVTVAVAAPAHYSDGPMPSALSREALSRVSFSGESLSRQALMQEFLRSYARADEALRAEDAAAVQQHIAHLQAIREHVDSDFAADMIQTLLAHAAETAADSVVTTNSAHSAQATQAPSSAQEDWCEQAWTLVVNGEWDELHALLSTVFTHGAPQSTETAALIELLCGLEAFLQGHSGHARSHVAASIRLMPAPKDVTFSRAAFALSAVLSAQAGREKRTTAELHLVELMPESAHALVQNLVRVLVLRAKSVLGEVTSEVELINLAREFARTQNASVAVFAHYLGNIPDSIPGFEKILSVACTCDTPLGLSLAATLGAMREPTVSSVQHAIEVCEAHRVRPLEKQCRRLLSQVSGRRHDRSRNLGGSVGGSLGGSVGGSVSGIAGGSLSGALGGSGRALRERVNTFREGVHALTVRETEVLELLKEGLSNRDISERLRVSVRTTESHVARVLQKLGVSRRHEVAQRRGHVGMILPSVQRNPDPVGGL